MHRQQIRLSVIVKSWGGPQEIWANAQLNEATHLVLPSKKMPMEAQLKKSCRFRLDSKWLIGQLVKI
ncbi:MAG: hypothetical protein ACI87E_004880 [Mariniblastus sp.]|jgi:hypothetical protein